jgi:hypothetical protein
VVAASFWANNAHELVYQLINSHHPKSSSARPARKHRTGTSAWSKMPTVKSKQSIDEFNPRERGLMELESLRTRKRPRSVANLVTFQYKLKSKQTCGSALRPSRCQHLLDIIFANDPSKLLFALFWILTKQEQRARQVLFLKSSPRILVVSKTTVGWATQRKPPNLLRSRWTHKSD